MASPYQDRVALITGGTGALGRAVVRHFLDGGAKVHVSWVVAGEVERLQASLGADFPRLTMHRADLTQEEDVAALFEAIEEADGGVDVLANIVGGFFYAALEDTESTIWRRMLEMNATTCFLCCRAAAPAMKRRGGGRIVNVAAMPALLRGAANMSAYAASKAAVLNFSHSLAAELGPEGIRVNVIVPTIIDTPANHEAMPDADTSTWLDPADIAAVVGFLASDAGRIVNGSELVLYQS